MRFCDRDETKAACNSILRLKVTEAYDRKDVGIRGCLVEYIKKRILRSSLVSGGQIIVPWCKKILLLQYTIKSDTAKISAEKEVERRKYAVSLPGDTRHRTGKEERYVPTSELSNYTAYLPGVVYHNIHRIPIRPRNIPHSSISPRVRRKLIPIS
ncbi:MAG: hypothetical protein WA323_05140 [Candidatus Nitrosopolaris sp.]